MANLISVAQAGNWLSLTPPQAAADPVLPGLVAAFSQFFLTLIARETLFPASYVERRDGNDQDAMAVFNAPIIAVSAVTIDLISVPLSAAFPQPGFYWDESTVRLAQGGASYPWSPYGFFGRFKRGRGNVLLTYQAGYPNVPVANEAQTVPSSPPYQITLAQAAAYQGSPVAQYVAGGTLAEVSSAPAAGQYVAAANGVLTFNAADAGAALLIGYEASGIPYDVQQCVCEMVGWAYKQKDRIGLGSETTPQAFVNSYSQQPTSPMAKMCVQRYKKKAVQW